MVAEIIHPVYGSMSPGGLHFTGISHDGANVLRVSTESIADLDKMKVHIKSGLIITFKDTPTLVFDIYPVMRDTVKFVKDSVISRFEPFF